MGLTILILLACDFSGSCFGTLCLNSAALAFFLDFTTDSATISKTLATLGFTGALVVSLLGSGALLQQKVYS